MSFFPVLVLVVIKGAILMLLIVLIGRGNLLYILEQKYYRNSS